MLVATTWPVRCLLNMRLLGDKFTDDPNNKASICARTIYDYYVSSNANRGTQFVFSDLATYKPNEWNIYSDIKEKLVRLGIPADEIQFIQCATTERARKRLFRGHEQWQGTGVVRLYLDVGNGSKRPRKGRCGASSGDTLAPADMEQRNGRAVRKGNTVKLWGNNTVDVVIYGTEK